MGSSTRGNILEGLAFSREPLTAYRLARIYNMNVAKVYGEIKRLSDLGLIRPTSMTRGVGYELVDEDLKSLALKFSSRVQTLESWQAEESRRARFRMGLERVPPFSLGRPTEMDESVQRKMPGSLDNLAALGRKKFDAKYGKRSERMYDRV